MGTLAAEARLARAARREACRGLKRPVDTGLAYTWGAASVLAELGLSPSMTRRIRTIQGQITERPAAVVQITLEGHALPVICLSGQPGDLEVLGAVTLEEVGLGVDPIQQRLVPAVQFGA